MKKIKIDWRWVAIVCIATGLLICGLSSCTSPLQRREAARIESQIAHYQDSISKTPFMSRLFVAKISCDSASSRSVYIYAKDRYDVNRIVETSVLENDTACSSYSVEEVIPINKPFRTR